MAFSSQKNFVHIPYQDEIDRLGCALKPEVTLTKYDPMVDNRTWSMDKEQFSQYLSYLVSCKLVTEGTCGDKDKKKASPCKKSPCSSRAPSPCPSPCPSTKPTPCPSPCPSPCPTPCPAPCKEKEDPPEVDPEIIACLCDKVKVLVKCGKLCPPDACELARMCKRLGELCDKYGVKPLPPPPCKGDCGPQGKAECVMKELTETQCKLMKQCEINKKLDCKLKEMHKAYKNSLAILCNTKAILKDQVKELRDDICVLKCKLKKMECIELENQSLSDQLYELQARLNLYDTQFKQLKDKTCTFKCNGYKMPAC